MTMTVHWVNQFAVVPDQPGGTRHFDMSRELRRRGHDVRVVASDLNLTTRTYSRRSRGRDLRELHQDVSGVPFTWLSAGSYRANDWRRVLSMVVFAGCAFVHLMRVRRARHSVFIGSSPQLFAALATWAASRLRRVPFVFEVRDLWPESYVEMTGNPHGLQPRLMRVVADLLYRRAAAIVVLAEPNIDRIVARGATRAKVVYVPNGVDMEAFRSGSKAAVDLSRPGAFTFVYAGTHGPANGLDVVVRACAELQRLGRDDIRVALVGDGPAKGEIRALAAELTVSNLQLCDPVPKAAMSAVLGTADAGLMVLADVDLFSYGVSPNKLFDYMGVGLPVLTNVPGIVGDIVKDADVGLVVAPGDPTALAAGMVALADNPPSGAAERGQAFIASNHERAVLAARLEECLVKVAG